MLQTGQIWGFASYIALSILAGIALVALGYSQFEAAKAVSKVERCDNDTVESVLKAAFKYLY